MPLIFLLVSSLFIGPPSAYSTKTPNDWLIIGEASFVKSEFHNAVLYFSKAIEENDKHTEAYLLRAKAYIHLSKYQLAMEDYQIAMKIDPDFVRTYLKSKKGPQGEKVLDLK